MADLNQTLLNTQTRPAVVSDCVALIEREVAGKGGLSGMAVKAVYSIVKKIKPSIIHEAVDRLLDAFVARLEQFYDAYQTKNNTGFTAFLTAQQHEVATALLGVTDDRIEKTNNAIIKRAYKKLRPMGQKHVEAAVPGVGSVIEPYV